MPDKSSRIAAVLDSFRGRSSNPNLLAYIDCFNRELFYEAHDVLEELWLPQRQGPQGPFYKGLIQMAGAFVHLQKGRLSPAVSLLKLARGNLMTYPDIQEGIEVKVILSRIEEWLARLEAGLPAGQSLSVLENRQLRIVA